jgi:hypothetical protein
VPTITRPAAPVRAASTAAPKVVVSRKPVGPPSDRWEGVGSHSNPSVYEQPKPGDLALTPAQIARGEQQLANLHPQVTRIRVDPTILQLQDPAFVKANPADAAAAQNRLGELQHSVSLALQHGGRADLCLWNLQKGYRTTPQEMKTVAREYAGLVKQLTAAHPNAKPGTFLVSAQNEPNRTKLSPSQVVSLYQDIDASLKSALGANGRKAVKLVAGELTQGDESAKWINAVVPKLGNVVEAFTFHVYMHPGETAEAYEGRLRGLRQEVDAAMPKGKPAPELLVTEYGVKGDRPAGARTDSPGTVTVKGKKVLLRESPEGGFKEAQALIALTHAGFSGAMRWGSNAGGPTPWDSWSMTGRPGEGFAKKPAYFATQLFTTAVGQGWIPEQGVATVRGQSVAAFRSPTDSGAASVVANSNTAAQRLSLGGFPPNAPVQVLVYNAGGKGQLASKPVLTDAKGFVTVSVPPHGVAAATTRLERPSPP